jgi:hypothetical protein
MYIGQKVKVLKVKDVYLIDEGRIGTVDVLYCKLYDNECLIKFKERGLIKYSFLKEEYLIPVKNDNLNYNGELL